ncbi:MAG: hypothetical protein OEQ28_02720 [Acidobacteriota bacterium]|nr:hypothetical protein [Acidobacteriota bacterium]
MSALNIISPDLGFAVTFPGNIETEDLCQTYAGKGLSFDVLKTAAMAGE